MQSLHRVEKSPPSDGTGGITVGDLSTQSIIKAVHIYPHTGTSPPLEMTVAAGAIGHTFGVRVQRVQRFRRWCWRLRRSFYRMILTPIGEL